MPDYKAAYRDLARSLIAQHGRLSEARCLRDHSLLLAFADGFEWPVREHAGQVMKYGYVGTGPLCFHAFLDEAGFDLSFDEVAALKDDCILRASERMHKDLFQAQELCPTGVECDLCKTRFPVCKSLNVSIREQRAVLFDCPHCGVPRVYFAGSQV